MAQSQVIPYLTGLSKNNLRFVLVTFDKPSYLIKIKQINELKRWLKKNNITWVSLKYHNIPNMPAKLYDILNGFLVCSKLIKKYNIQIVHARSYIAGAIAFLLKRRFNLHFIFDIRGVLFDERADSGNWNRQSLKYKIGKKIEKVLFNKSDEIVVLSEKGKKIIKKNFLSNTKINVSYIPTCVNLDLFKKDNEKRKVLRKKVGLNNKKVVVYSGSIGAWYLFSRMIDFFKEFKRKYKNAHFLILTQKNKKEIEGELLKHIKQKDFSIYSGSYSHMKEFLSLADAGISFIKPCYSKQFSCPTKIAEYLACELPVIANSKVGDIDRIILKNKIGVVINKFNRSEYLKNINRLIKLKKDKSLGSRCRNIAKREYDLRKGIGKYQNIYKRLK